MKKMGKQPLLESYILVGKQTIRNEDYLGQDQCYEKQNGNRVDSVGKAEG